MTTCKSILILTVRPSSKYAPNVSIAEVSYKFLQYEAWQYQENRDMQERRMSGDCRYT